MRRSSRASRRGLGMAAAARALVGGDGCARMSSRERARGGERMQRVREKSEGTRGIVVALLGGAGGLRGVSRGHGSKQGGRRWRAVAVHAPGTRCASDWREEEDLPAPGGLGWADGLPGERQVSSFSFIYCFCFLFFCSFRALLKIPEQTQKSRNCSWILFRILPTTNILVHDYLDI